MYPGFGVVIVRPAFSIFVLVILGCQSETSILYFLSLSFCFSWQILFGAVLLLSPDGQAHEGCKPGSGWSE